MKRVDFYTLPRAVQDHVVDSLAGRLVPVPILANYGARPTALYWWALSALSVVATVLLCVVGFGNASSALSLHPLPVVVLYVVLVAAFAAGVLNALSYRARVKALPFAPGIYLFPANVIDAREARLRVFPLEQLTSAGGGAGGSVVLTFGSERFSLPLADARRLPEALARIEEAKQRAASETDPRVRFELDALEPPSVMSPLAPQHQLLFAAPIWVRLRWPIAALVGVALGGGIFRLRNTSSDNSMLATAQAKNDVAGYRAYVQRGKRHHDLVANVLLPRAELALAVEDGSVEAIDAFIAAHPKTGIQREVDAARRAALGREFERAKAKGTAAALLEFAARHPHHGLGAAYDKARHALFRRALSRFEKMAPEEAKTVPLVESLLAYSEKRGAKLVGSAHRGPAVQIRFARREPISMGRADSAVSKNPSFNGVTSYPSRYFDAKHLAPFEQQLGQSLAKRLGRAFEPELLTFEPGPPIEWPEDGLPAVKQPTIAVRYRVEWSGGAFAKTKPRAVIIGLFVFFRSSFALPGEEPVQLLKFTPAENVPHSVIDDAPAGEPAGTLETAAYQAMTRDAFDQFEKRYLAKWFK